MTNNTITQIEEEIIREFSVFSDWMDKYEMLIETGKELGEMPERYRGEEYLIRGCQSQVWLGAECSDGKVYFFADSDAIITKGIIGLLIRVLSGQDAGEVMNAEMKFVEAIGLREHLSPTRANGLVAMIKQMKMYAMAFHLKNKAQ
ncbi:MAG: SufE family protein [Bacteroidetes bacterium]|nr:SufE family protein [Bacteroidota bacterium]MBU1718467.1 SufE family protein [Bacteroidota bacterium]